MEVSDGAAICHARNQRRRHVDRERRARRAVELSAGEFTGEPEITSLQIGTFSSVSKAVIRLWRLEGSNPLPLRFRLMMRWADREPKPQADVLYVTHFSSDRTLASLAYRPS